MERIDVWRGEPGLDADGNTVQGPLELITSFSGLVAPVNTPETASEPTGILDTDLIGVRGRRVPVDGAVCEWRRKDGTHVGDVVNVKLKEG